MNMNEVVTQAGNYEGGANCTCLITQIDQYSRNSEATQPLTEYMAGGKQAAGLKYNVYPTNAGPWCIKWPEIRTPQLQNLSANQQSFRAIQ